MLNRVRRCGQQQVSGGGGGMGAAAAVRRLTVLAAEGGGDGASKRGLPGPRRTANTHHKDCWSHRYSVGLYPPS